MVLKRNNGQKRALTSEKRALNIRKEVRQHPTHSLRYATDYLKMLDSALMFFRFLFSQKTNRN